MYIENYLINIVFITRNGFRKLLDCVTFHIVFQKHIFYLNTLILKVIHQSFSYLIRIDLNII